jgi:hypothetical protein
LNLGSRGGKPATNRLSYGAAHILNYLSLLNIFFKVKITPLPGSYIPVRPAETQNQHLHHWKDFIKLDVGKFIAVLGQL